LLFYKDYNYNARLNINLHNAKKRASKIDNAKRIRAILDVTSSQYIIQCVITGSAFNAALL